MKRNWLTNWLFKDVFKEIEDMEQENSELVDKAIKALIEAKKIRSSVEITTIPSFKQDDMEYVRKVVNALTSDEVKFFLYKYEYVDLPAYMAENKFSAEFLLNTKIAMQELRRSISALESMYDDHLKSLEEVQGGL
jgi:vacuolar-type H+-ATPase subunit D/Vma8